MRVDECSHKKHKESLASTSEHVPARQLVPRVMGDIVNKTILYVSKPTGYRQKR